jgi:hypothetical protein
LLPCLRLLLRSLRRRLLADRGLLDARLRLGLLRLTCLLLGPYLGSLLLRAFLLLGPLLRSLLLRPLLRGGLGSTLLWGSSRPALWRRRLAFFTLPLVLCVNR